MKANTGPSKDHTLTFTGDIQEETIFTTYLLKSINETTYIVLTDRSFVHLPDFLRRLREAKEEKVVHRVEASSLFFWA